MLPFLSSQCLTLGSRLGTKLVNTKALYNVFDGTARKDWMPVSATCMTPICSYSCLFSSTLFCHSVEQIRKNCIRSAKWCERR
ncbi:WPE palindromic element domain-containing protein [Wolbachia endosymbiont (group A) of Anomoia purmunda]|uniref:WPE palindromic element domain-containing protein n=1 Tax=Wolbachia endosymbiont (group A) of Anomoia purmunda TaxID=2953978 RepID=UPI002230D059|nr:WPE palindromic element domain-containing protein [Wolbachia endosymbiont (group A) of Anomoia purmunda]